MCLPWVAAHTLTSPRRPAHTAFCTPFLLTGPLHPPPAPSMGNGTSPPLPLLVLHPLLTPRLLASSPRLLPASLPGCSLLKDPGNHSFVHLFIHRSASSEADHLCPQRAGELVSRINRISVPKITSGKSTGMENGRVGREASRGESGKSWGGEC